MKRVIISAPAGIALDMLTDEQRAGINAVFGQFVLPMPGTVESDGQIVIDATTNDNFDTRAIVDLELPFGVLGCWQWDGATLTELQPLSETFIDYLPLTHEYDAEGNVTATHPPVLHMPHNFAGWQDVI